MSARCPKCHRLLCDHPVPRRSAVTAADGRQLILPFDGPVRGHRVAWVTVDESAAIAPNPSLSSRRTP